MLVIAWKMVILYRCWFIGTFWNSSSVFWKQLAQLVIGKVKGVVLAYCTSEVCQWEQIQCMMFASLDNSGPKCKCFIRQSLVMFRWNWAPHHNTQYCITESKNLCGVRHPASQEKTNIDIAFDLWPHFQQPTLPYITQSTHIEGQRMRAAREWK